RVHRRGSARGHAGLHTPRLGPGAGAGARAAAPGRPLHVRADRRGAGAPGGPHRVGRTMGGMIAAEMACLAPHELGKLVLVSPAGLWMDEHPIPDIFALLPYQIAEVLFHDP